MYLQCSPVVGGRLYSYNFIKRELHYIFFLTIFQSFRCSYFKIPSLNHMWWSLVEFWTVHLYKNYSSRDNFLKFLEVKLSPLKNLWWITFLVATCNICKNRLVDRRCLSGYCEIYHSNFSAISLKRSITELFLHGSCAVALFKSSINVLRDIVAKHFLTKSQASNL